MNQQCTVCILLFTVIEVSCGEYGDNIKNLVNAIRNGKHDIREGYAFPEKEVLNNSNAKDNDAPSDSTNAKDKNDVNNIEDKFCESKLNDKSNGGMISSYGKNDIVKQSTAFYLPYIRILITSIPRSGQTKL